MTMPDDSDDTPFERWMREGEREGPPLRRPQPTERQRWIGFAFGLASWIGAGIVAWVLGLIVGFW